MEKLETINENFEIRYKPQKGKESVLELFIKHNKEKLSKNPQWSDADNLRYLFGEGRAFLPKKVVCGTKEGYKLLKGLLPNKIKLTPYLFEKNMYKIKYNFY